MEKNIQEILRRIQEEAKKTVADRLKKTAKPESEQPKPQPESAVDLNKIAEKLQEQIATASSKAMATYASNRHNDILIGKIYDISSRLVQESKKTPLDIEKAIIYPNNCKFLVTNDEGSGVLVIEESPRYRTISKVPQDDDDNADGYNAEDEDASEAKLLKKAKHYRIALPYIVYIIPFRANKQKNGSLKYNCVGFGIGFGKKPIQSINQKMLVTTFPHVTGNSSVCQPLEIEKNFDTVEEMSKYAIETFWNSSFHYDLYDFSVKINNKTEYINDFEEWQSKIKNPLDILNGNFGTGYSIEETIKSSFMSYVGTYNSTTQKLINQFYQETSNRIENNKLSDLIYEVAKEIAEEAIKLTLQPETKIV